jgi:hypothetical protein
VIVSLAEGLGTDPVDLFRDAVVRLRGQVPSESTPSQQCLLAIRHDLQLEEIVMNQVSRAEAEIRAKVRMVVADESLWDVLSTGERVAVALVLDRPDLLTFWGSMLESVERLGPEWTQAALRVQRDGWERQL